jgi:hypothetical protein
MDRVSRRPVQYESVRKPYSSTAGCGKTILRYPAPNLDRALAPSWVGRFCCLTQELVTRLNFGSASAQVAPPLLPLLTLLLTFCPNAAQGLSLASPIISPASEPLLLLANHALPAAAVPSNFLSTLREGLAAQF